MLLRLTEEYRRGPATWAPGDLLDAPDDEAARLIEEGRAVPATDDLARETRGPLTHAK